MRPLIIKCFSWTQNPFLSITWLTLKFNLSKLPSATKQINHHLLPPARHDPDCSLAGRRSVVWLLSRCIQVWGRVLLPYGGGQWGVRIPLTVRMCLLLRPLHLSRYFILRHWILDKWGGGGWSGPRRDPQARLRSLWAFSPSRTRMVSL